MLAPEQSGKTCMMCGDGANNAGALKQAYVSLAMRSYSSLNAHDAGYLSIDVADIFSYFIFNALTAHTRPFLSTCVPGSGLSQTDLRCCPLWYVLVPRVTFGGTGGSCSCSRALLFIKARSLVNMNFTPCMRWSVSNTRCVNCFV